MMDDFRPCTMESELMGYTELLLSDCVIVWERWDEKTEIGRNTDGILVAARFYGLAAKQNAGGGE